MFFDFIKSRWYKISIKNKQLTFFIIIIFFVSLISLYSQYNTYNFMNVYSDNLNNYYKINKLLIEIQKNNKYIEDYLRNGDKKDYSNYIENTREFEDLMENVEKDVKTMDAYFQIRAINNSFTAYKEKCENAISMKSDENENYFIPLYEGFRIAQYTRTYIQELLNVSLKEGAWTYNNEIMSTAEKVKKITFISILGIFLLSIGFALMFSNYLTNPIRKLAEASINMSKGDLVINNLEIKSMDEIGVLSRAFKTMNINIKKYVDDLKEKAIIEKKLHEEEIKNIKMEKLLKEAEFLGLQSQINPHFLFNTLNVISRTSMFENAHNTTKLIQELSNIFRYNLCNQRDEVTLKREMEVTNSYIEIQKFRFGERFKPYVYWDKEIEGIKIPCLSIQPIVENAFIHGIEPCEKGGKINIRAFRRKNSILIKIFDSGVGMAKEKIRSILNLEEKKALGHTTSIGLSNVINRLMIYFNYEAKVSIRSKKGIGTMVSISIPVIEQEKHND